MKGFGVTLEFTLASCRVYNRALKMKNHKWHELAWHVDRNNLKEYVHANNESKVMSCRVL